MIGGECEDGALAQPEVDRTAHHAEIARQRFQPSQAIRRFRQVVEVTFERCPDMPIRTLNLRQGKPHRWLPPQIEMPLQNNHR